MWEKKVKVFKKKKKKENKKHYNKQCKNKSKIKKVI